MSDIDSQIAAAEELYKQSQRALEERSKRLQADDRSVIAKLIISVFVALIFVVVVAVIYGTYLFGWEEISEPAKFLMAILGSVMLPVVTLVIGYYFANK
jgi:ABC-type glycerol-3-phosphate transport system permease component